MLSVCAGTRLTKLSTHSLVRRFVAPGEFPTMCSRSGATSVYTSANSVSLTFQDPAARLPGANACVISALALVGLATDTILARPPALPVISPRTLAVVNTAALVVNVASAPGVFAVAGTVSVALGALGAGYVAVPPPRQLTPQLGLVTNTPPTESAGFATWINRSFCFGFVRTCLPETMNPRY